MCLVFFAESFDLMGLRSTLLNLSVSARLALCLAVSAGLHLVAVWGDWYVQPARMAGPVRGVRVSLVSASPEVPVEESATLFEQARSETAKREPSHRKSVRVKSAPAPKLQAQEVPRAKPLPDLPAQEAAPVAAVPQAPQPEAQPKSEPGPESVFQSMDLVCAARQRDEGGETEGGGATAESPGAVKMASLPSPTTKLGEIGSTNKSDLLDATPRYRSNPLPDYPYLARQRHWEGVVWLMADVSRKGRVTALKVAESSGYGVLDKSALKSVRRWRFDPARSLGVAVDSQVRVPVEFRLEN